MSSKKRERERETKPSYPVAFLQPVEGFFEILEQETQRSETGTVVMNSEEKLAQSFSEG